MREGPSSGSLLASFLGTMRGGVRPGRSAALALPVLLWACLLAGPTRGTPVSPGDRIDFRRDIQPIFEASCTKCHGATRQRSQLRLDSPSFALHGGVMGPVIVPGDGAGSRLVQLVSDSDPTTRM